MRHDVMDFIKNGIPFNENDMMFITIHMSIYYKLYDFYKNRYDFVLRMI